MNPTTRFKVIGGWALLVLIGVATIAWLQPGMLGEARAELAALELRRERAQDGAAEIRRLASELSNLKESTTAIKHVPSDSQFARLNQELGNRLEVLGITDREITNGGSVELGPARSIPMRIRMTCGFMGVYQTIQWIETLPRLVRVQRIRIESTEAENPWESEVEVEITLDAVFDPEATQGALTLVDPEATR
ncbi:MAG: type 4a pilus biogenesis protein PilO [Phycisphaeraceae bacterium]|nr:type 4a pilus biogenesis protein PilO [Phycisphaeraceae bacterium]